MAIDRLDAPLRLTWTLKAGSLNPEDVELLAHRVAHCGAFFVTLRGDFYSCPQLETVVSILCMAGVQTTLVLPWLRPENRVLPAETTVLLDLTEWLLCGDACEQLAKVESAGMSDCGDGFCLVPLRPLLSSLPGVLDFAGRCNLPLHLTNVPLADDPDRMTRLLPRAADLQGLTKKLAHSDRSNWPEQVVVHDLFLWQLLFPGRDRDHYIGCQAGNSIAHIDSAGMLHPCISWIHPLGSLLQDELPHLWQDPARRSLLDGLENAPDGCVGCGMLDRCHGGCRGLVQACGDDGSTDLLCPGPQAADC